MANKKEKIKNSYYGLMDIFHYDKRLNIVRQVLYVSTVFLGLTLTWYGVYAFIAATWPLNIPIVAIVIGVALLYINGKTSRLT